MTFDVDDPGLPYLVTMSVCANKGRLACGEVTVTQRPDGPPVTGAALRSVTIDSYLRLIRRDLANPESHGGMVLIKEVGRTEQAVFYEPPDEEALLAFDSAQRRRLSKDEMLPLVADAYRAALSSDDDYRRPTEAVGCRLHVSRGHAARLVSQARKAGLLGPARRGASGELPLSTDGGGPE